ncbi:MAG: hypothetical protein PHD04_00640 [Candidatus Pacebacteria bacterium]|nr:hypothetical protein [Candidatus Paceibacterota bacterium]
MTDDLTNLLPSERRAALSRDYLVRLSVVASVFVAVLVLVAIVLLIPTYVFLRESSRAKTERLATIEATFSSSDEASLSTRLTTLSQNAATLTALAEAPSASGIIRSVLAVARPGISLSSLAYTPRALSAPSTLAVSGVARTRDTLRTYQLALQRSPLARSADLPVSAYAKDSDITFTITITLAP